jgi:hypothetical protein
LLRWFCNRPHFSLVGLYNWDSLLSSSTLLSRFNCHYLMVQSSIPPLFHSPCSLKYKYSSERRTRYIHHPFPTTPSPMYNIRRRAFRPQSERFRTVRNDPFRQSDSPHVGQNTKGMTHSDVLIDFLLDKMLQVDMGVSPKIILYSAGGRINLSN